MTHSNDLNKVQYKNNILTKIRTFFTRNQVFCPNKERNEKVSFSIQEVIKNTNVIYFKGSSPSP